MKLCGSLFCFIAWLLLGCSGTDSDRIAQVGDRIIKQIDFQHYLQYENIQTKDANRVRAALAYYLEREAVAQAIEASAQLDKQRVSAQLNEIKKEMLISRYFEAYLDQFDREDVLRAYYAEHQDQYQSKKVRIAHILIRIKPNSGQAEINAARTKADEAYGRLTMGESFSKLAAQYSDDAMSNIKGGDLGWVKSGIISKSFSDKAFALVVGAFSTPIRTAYGYHIIQQIEAPTVIKESFETVKGDIRYLLRYQAKEAEYQRLKALLPIKTF